MDFEYSLRNDYFSEEKTYYLTESALGIRSSSGTFEWRYQDIVSVHLLFKPSRMKTDKYECHIKHCTGAEIVLTNYDFKGIGNFVNKKTEYVKFLTAFHRLLSLKNPNVIFKGGLEKGAYVAKIVTYVLLAIFLLAVGVFAIRLNFGLVIIKIGLLIFLLPIMVKDLKCSKPVTYDGKEIPCLLIPN